MRAMEKSPSRFTLIELLVVIAIIAILASLLLPGLKKAKSLAKIRDCGSKQRQIMIAAISYATDFSGYMPPNLPGSSLGDYWCQPIVSDAWTTPRTWGMGKLMENNYLPMSAGAVLWCTGFEVDNSAADKTRYTEFVARQSSGVFGPTGLHDFTFSSFSFCSSGRWNSGSLTSSANINDKYLNTYPLMLICGSFVYSNYYYTTGWSAYDGGKPHDLSGCNLSFIDGHVQFYSMKSLLFQASGNFWTTLSREPTPWYWTNSKFNSM